MKANEELKLYYPWGAIGPGYWLTSDEIDIIQSKEKKSIVVIYLLILSFSFFLGVVKSFLICCLFYTIHCAQLLYYLRNKVKSDRRMSIINNIKSYSSKISFFKIFIFIVFNFLMNFLGLKIIMSPKNNIFGFFVLLFFSMSQLILMLLLYFKIKKDR